MQGFMREYFCDKFDVKDVILKNENFFLGYRFPHNELLSVFFSVYELKSLLKLSKVSMSVCGGKVFAKGITITAHGLGLVNAKDFGTPDKFLDHELNASFHMLMVFDFSFCKLANLMVFNNELYVKVQVLNYFHKIEHENSEK